MSIIPKNTRILLAEDDVNLGFLLVEFLEANGYQVKLYRNGLSALKGYKANHFDFGILDIMLPEMDGFSLAEAIREKDSEIPLIFLSARSMREDKIRGFRIGVDDYITKPFDEEELLCRIEAIMNRVRPGNVNNGTNKNDTAIDIGNYRFDPANQMLAIDERMQRLTLKESKVLCKLGLSKNKLVKREDIMTDIWGEADYYKGRSLDVFISKIRSYLKYDSSIRITTIPTVGYILEEKSPPAV
ncbi:MAG: response regulator transcription factor [Bacteroidia bacterium]|nr:MAG: response regulator transcription factor [Bacteroidia bacterium]